MRISDWSSDVCSSDLFVSRALMPQGDVGKRRAEEFVWPDRPFPAGRPVRCLDICELEGADGHRMAGHMRLVPGGARSEEHTSELQSLMRISYAVFCLKKKKTKTGLTMMDYLTSHRQTT